MHHGRAPAAAGDRTGPRQERGLTGVTFVGSYPAADFRVRPPLPEIAFIGRSNVGKSSLINALAGRRQVARVSRTPGKTRACNVFNVNDRWYLVDLPGYGYARASRTDRASFQALLRDYVGRRQELTAAIWLLDIRRDPSPDDLAMAEQLGARALPLLAAVTKADKIPRGQRPTRVEAILKCVGVPGDQAVVTSVKTGEGIRDLRDSIEALVR